MKWVCRWWGHEEPVDEWVQGRPIIRCPRCNSTWPRILTVPQQPTEDLSRPDCVLTGVCDPHDHTHRWPCSLSTL